MFFGRDFAPFLKAFLLVGLGVQLLHFAHGTHVPPADHAPRPAAENNDDLHEAHDDGSKRRIRYNVERHIHGKDGRQRRRDERLHGLNMPHRPRRKPARRGFPAAVLVIYGQIAFIVAQALYLLRAGNRFALVFGQAGERRCEFLCRIFAILLFEPFERNARVGKNVRSRAVDLRVLPCAAILPRPRRISFFHDLRVVLLDAFLRFQVILRQPPLSARKGAKEEVKRYCAHIHERAGKAYVFPIDISVERDLREVRHENNDDHDRGERQQDAVDEARKCLAFRGAQGGQELLWFIVYHSGSLSFIMNAPLLTFALMLSCQPLNLR